jgi:hypothetical protein
MPRQTSIIIALVLWLASIGSGSAQTISNAPPLPAPAVATDQLFIFRGTAPVYSTTVGTLLAGLTTGVFGPASSTNGFIPLWNGALGNLLSAGLPVGQTGVSTVIETNSSGFIAASILPSAVSLLGNTTTGTGAVVLQSTPTLTSPNITGGLLTSSVLASATLTSPTLTSATLTSPILTSASLTSATLTSPVIAATGASFLGSVSGSVTLLVGANAGGTITLPNATGNAVTTGDTGTVTNAMLLASSITINGTSCQLGGTCNVPLSFNNLTIINTPIQYTTLPAGTPKTYACFDVNGNLISSWYRCAP